MTRRAALLVVDVQNDFCPGGAVPVPRGDSIIPALNTVIEEFGRRGLPVLFTRDWHPPNHCSFKAQGGVWPPHCVQGTKGAELHAGVLKPPGSETVSKGTLPDQEAYSGFQGTGLAEKLRAMGVGEVFIGGLATEFCVRSTAEDASREGFSVHLVLDCVRGLEASPGDSAAAIDKAVKAGATTTVSTEVAGLIGAQQ